MRDIKNYEQLYAITKDGKVWSYITKKFLKPRLDKNGYLIVNLSKNGVKKTHLIHRLVAETYIKNPNNLPCINHISEDKMDNRVENLEYRTYLYNNTYGTRIQRIQKSVYCKELNKVFNSINQASLELKVDPSKIVKCCKGKQKSTGGYHFEYMEVI